jgi:hypothetical protein
MQYIKMFTVSFHLNLSWTLNSFKVKLYILCIAEAQILQYVPHLNSIDICSIVLNVIKLLLAQALLFHFCISNDFKSNSELYTHEIVS